MSPIDDYHASGGGFFEPPEDNWLHSVVSFLAIALFMGAFLYMLGAIAP